MGVKGLMVGAESPLWLLLQVSPVRNEKETVVLLLIVVKDITALRQPIDEDSYSRGMTSRAPAGRSVSQRYNDANYPNPASLAGRS